MFRQFHAVICLIFILLIGTSAAYTAETTTTEPEKPAATKTGTSTTTKPATAAKPATTTAGKTTSAPKPKKYPVMRTLDTQLSGYTSQDADSIYARMSMDEKRDGRTWYARGSITRTATNVNRTNHVLTYKLDSRHEQMRNKEEYNVFTGVISARDRGSASKKVRKSGYELAAYGIGKQWHKSTKAELGLGLLNVRDEETGIKPALVAAIRGKKPLSSKLALNTDILAIQPMNDLRSTKLDSDIGLAYEMAPGFFLRLDWQATNLIRSTITYKEWDSVLRLSISFRKTTTSE